MTEQDESAVDKPHTTEEPAEARPTAQSSVERPHTGEPTIDEAIEGLGALDDRPVTEHIAVFDEAHRKLQDALADLDEE